MELANVLNRLLITHIILYGFFYACILYYIILLYIKKKIAIFFHFCLVIKFILYLCPKFNQLNF